MCVQGAAYWSCIHSKSVNSDGKISRQKCVNHKIRRNLVSIWHFYWEYCVFYTFIDNFLQRLNINKTTFLRKIQIVCGVSFPQIPLAYGTTLDRSYLFKILSNLRFSCPSFPCFLARSSLCDRRPLAKTLKLAVWAFSLIFLLDSTLFVIDIHQNIPLLLVLTPFDHF